MKSQPTGAGPGAAARALSTARAQLLVVLQALNRKAEPFFDVLRKIVHAFAFLSGAAVFAMIAVTAADVLLRIFKVGIPGAYDLVRIAGVVAITCSLPYVTAVKGHIAIEFFYQNFSRGGRIFLDTAFRLLILVLFAVLVQRNVLYSFSLYSSGEVMPTLRIPIFWIPLMIGFSFILVWLIVLYHILHPGKEMIKL